MAEAIPLRALPPDAPVPPPSNPNPNPNPNPHPNPNPNPSSLPSSSCPPDQDRNQQVEFPYRFQRTDLWKPVYKWLESLEKEILVTGKEISDWLESNRDVMEKLSEKHSRYHLVHYTQRMHLKLLKKRGKLPKGLQLSAARASLKAQLNGGRAKPNIIPNIGIKKREKAPAPGRFSSGVVKDKKMLLSKKKEALLKYELLTDLHNQLTRILLKNKAKDVQELPRELGAGSTGQSIDTAMVLSKSDEAVKINPRAQHIEAKAGQKRKRNPIIVTPAWSYSEISAGNNLKTEEQPSSSKVGERKRLNIWKGHTDDQSLSLPTSIKNNILICLHGQEIGTSWRQACSHGRYAGRNREKWGPFFAGWNSLGKQFVGPTIHMKRNNYRSAWGPAWFAYTSSATSAGQPNARQELQKVLNVKFHPDGLPQLVCTSNKGPNELLLYNLRSGRVIQLKGHNSQIQAVDFAVRGASVVSCSSNLLKVWDCITGSCLYTLGSDNESSVRHTERINSMAVNKWQSCLVVTSGAKGDGKLLLWNALRGELYSDLNSNLRLQDPVCPSINAMEFCNEALLACGSDYEPGGSSVVQLWDIDCTESYLCFSASDSYITSLKVNPTGSTIITGSGDGTIGLFDIRTCASINHLSVGPGSEVTSVSFSGCGKYFSAASTSNSTLVWDTRFVPTNITNNSGTSKDMRFFRPLHCLSHGTEFPSPESTSQLHNVNDAQWLHRDPVLVTVSSDGSMAMWDVTLGRPCIRHAVSHSLSANTITVAPNDEYLCTGGDDQKIVLYHDKSGRMRLNWRLPHPVSDKE